MDKPESKIKTTNDQGTSVICNIDHVEAGRRMALAVIAGVTLVCVSLLYLIFGRTLIIAVFLSSFLAIVNFLQARRKFCVAFALAGIRNDRQGIVERSLPNEIIQHRLYIIRIFLEALIYSIGITSVVFLLGLI